MATELVSLPLCAALCPTLSLCATFPPPVPRVLFPPTSRLLPPPPRPSWQVMEEAGIRVGRVRLHSTQPWPFPYSLMIGCVAEALSDTIRVDTKVRPPAVVGPLLCLGRRTPVGGAHVRARALASRRFACALLRWSRGGGWRAPGLPMSLSLPLLFLFLSSYVPTFAAMAAGVATRWWCTCRVGRGFPPTHPTMLSPLTHSTAALLACVCVPPPALPCLG